MMGEHCAAFGKHAFTKSARHNAVPGKPVVFLRTRTSRLNFTAQFERLSLLFILLFPNEKNEKKETKEKVPVFSAVPLALLAAGFSTNNSKLC